jgi:hypothetical protein
MATKRQPSKQRRQAQNQKQRAALDARRQAAASASSSASAPRAASSGARSGGGSVLSRLRGATAAGRVARTGGTGTPVGHRAALSAVFAAVAATVVGSFVYQVPVDRSGDAIATRGALIAEWTLSADEVALESPGATPEEIAGSVDDWLPGGTDPYLVAAWPISLGMLLPVIGTALGLRAVSRRSPAKVVNRTMYVALFGALLAGPLLLVFLPAVISLAVASFQVRKAELAARDAAPADGVIEVDEVEAADTDDEVVDVDEVVEVDGEAGADVDAADDVEAERP